MENTTIPMVFGAIDKKFVESIPTLTQDTARNKDYVYYGEDNLYPEYLWSLYNDVSTLKTIIDGTADYITGDDVHCNIPGMEVQVNRKGDTMRDLIKWLSKDYEIYGGCAYEVVRNKNGRPAELNYIDFRYLRTDKKNQSFYYSEDYSKKWVRSSNVLVYPKFIQDSTDVSSIVYIKNTTSTPYPIPRYSGAIRACEIERHIDDFHLSGLQNGFAPSYIINFASGIPTDEQKKEIEKNVQEKFCGTGNSGRIMLNFATSKENLATVQKLDVQDFGDKYQAAAKRSREQIFTAMGAVPALFGLMSESTGFNSQEFSEAFALYNATTVKSIQRTIIDSFDKVFNTKGSVTIDTFTVNNSNNTVNNDETVS